MPDLGQYAFEVLLAYAGSAALLIAIVWASWAQARRSKRLLEESEERRDG